VPMTRGTGLLDDGVALGAGREVVDDAVSIPVVETVAKFVVEVDVEDMDVVVELVDEITMLAEM
jgi:hypothetical protein